MADTNAKKPWIIIGDTEVTEKGGDPGITPWLELHPMIDKI